MALSPWSSTPSLPLCCLRFFGKQKGGKSCCTPSPTHTHQATQHWHSHMGLPKGPRGGGQLPEVLGGREQHGGNKGCMGQHWTGSRVGQGGTWRGAHRCCTHSTGREQEDAWSRRCLLPLGWLLRAPCPVPPPWSGSSLCSETLWAGRKSPWGLFDARSHLRSPKSAAAPPRTERTAPARPPGQHRYCGTWGGVVGSSRPSCTGMEPCALQARCDAGHKRVSELAAAEHL